jgi:hypothetical protein
MPDIRSCTAAICQSELQVAQPGAAGVVQTVNQDAQTGQNTAQIASLNDQSTN